MQVLIEWFALIKCYQCSTERIGKKAIYMDLKREEVEYLVDLGRDRILLNALVHFTLSSDLPMSPISKLE